MPKLKITSTPAKKSSRQQEIKQYIAAIGEFETRPDGKELSAIIKAVREGDTAATEKAKRIWLRTIIEVAKQCASFTDLPFDVLVAAGTDGLVKCMHRMPNEDKFFSFFLWWIKQSIMRRIIENGDNIP